MFQLVVYVPASDLSLLKKGLFAAGAGNIGEYSYCCWQTLGVGQFLPSQQSNPSVGDVGELTRTEEWRVEVVVAEECLAGVIEALHRYHPYETPAFHYWQVNGGGSI